MSTFLTSVGVSFAVGSLMIALWDHCREEEHRATLYISPDSWDYGESRTPVEENRDDRAADMAILRLFVSSLLFFLIVVGIYGWLS